MKKLIIISLLMLAVPLKAQAPTAITIPSWPDVATPGLAYATAATAWMQQVQVNENALVGVVNQQAAQMTIMQAQIATLQAQLATLIQPPPPPAATSVDLTAFPTGPLNGSDSGIQWNTGQWTATGQGVAPAMLGVARNFVLPTNVTMTSIAVQCMTQSCVIKFTDAAGEVLSSPTLTPGSITVLNTSWTKPSGAVQVSTPSSPATDLRLVQLKYQ
jgi:hypothetical protein